MSYVFTKLSDVPVVAEFPEGANAVIETNGEIRRCPSSGGGGGFDFVIKVTADGTTLSKGDYNSIQAKLLNCEAVLGACAVKMGIMSQTGIFKSVITSGDTIICMMDNENSYTIASDNTVT